MINCTYMLNFIDLNILYKSLRSTQILILTFLKCNYVSNFSLYNFYKIFNELSVQLDFFNISYNAFKDKLSELLIS